MSTLKRLVADARRIELIILVALIAATVSNALHGDVRAVIPGLGWAFAFAENMSLRANLRRAEMIPPNTVLVSTVEPSYDARQFASAITQVRTALINEGNSPAEATDLVRAWLSAQNGGPS